MPRTNHELSHEKYDSPILPVEVRQNKCWKHVENARKIEHPMGLEAESTPSKAPSFDNTYTGSIQLSREVEQYHYGAFQLDYLSPMNSGKCGNVSGFAAPDTRAGMHNGSDRYAHRVVLIQSFRLISMFI